MAQRAFRIIQICRLPHGGGEEEKKGRKKRKRQHGQHALHAKAPLFQQAAGGDYKASLISQQDAGGHGRGKNSTCAIPININ